MINNNLSLSHQEIIADPFVFITYCWADPEIKKRVRQLVNKLRTSGVPVLYDEGGTEPGENIVQLEYQIQNENCKCVLVVMDHFYVENVRDRKGGVNDEFDFILSDFKKNPLKYVPLFAGEVVPLFNYVTYINFRDNSHFQKITNTCLEKLGLSKAMHADKESKASVSRSVKRLFISADSLYDKQDYTGALRKLDEAIDKCDNKKMMLRLKHLKLNIYLKLNKAPEALALAEEMKPMIPKNCDQTTKTRCYGNIALAHRLNDIKSSEYENYARKAYIASRRLPDKAERIYYEMLYGGALFETEQYCDAYDVEEEALEDFMVLYPDESAFDSVQIEKFVKIKCNLAETAMFCSKNKDGKARYKALAKSEEHLLAVSHRIAKLADDNVKAEAYRIIASIYNELHKYFK